MHSRLRIYYVLLSVAVCSLFLLQHLIINTHDENDSVFTRQRRTSLPSIPPKSYLQYQVQDAVGILETLPLPSRIHKSSCRMDNCFDYSKCTGDFKVYVYPENEGQQLSEAYRKILSIIRRSSFSTNSPANACVFVTSLDTTDRDKISANYVHNLEKHLHELPYWNDGKNHILFNLYSGTWPDYSEHLDIDYGYAFLAKSSVSIQHFRSKFDISLPLFHNTLPERAGEPGKLDNLNTPSVRNYLIGFKGKRYLVGIGSQSRNALHHMHNDKDIIMLTTCKHGKGWEKIADERCAIDNQLYDKYDYQELLANSTFCLVPRGRRLGSFRFLEVLQYGCIPVILSDNWELPFSEVIDWKQAAVLLHEKLLFQLPDVVRSIPMSVVVAQQQQSQLLWNRYFSSLDKIVLTTLEIVRNRVKPQFALPSSVWNSHPDAHHLSTDFSRDLTRYPFFQSANQSHGLTAVVLVTGDSLTRNLYKLLETISFSTKVTQVLLFAIGEDLGQRYGDLNNLEYYKGRQPPQFIPVNNVVEAFSSLWRFENDAVMILRPHKGNNILPEEIDFLHSTWTEFPTQLVGLLSRTYFWHQGQQRYHYTSQLKNSYSLVLSDGAIVHKYYLYQYSTLSEAWPETAELNRCLDIVLNFLVADISGLAPIKVGPRLVFEDSGRMNLPQLEDILDLQTMCFNLAVEKFGYVPLKDSQVRFDPTLFKDAVSITRKKYSNMEELI